MTHFHARCYIKSYLLQSSQTMAGKNEKKTLTGFGLLLCGTDATTISNSKKPCTAVTSRYSMTSTSCFLAFCFCHLLSDQDAKPDVDHNPKPRLKMVEASSFQRMARSLIAQVLHKFSQAPGTPINSKPSHGHELSATNHKVTLSQTMSRIPNA